MVRRHNAIARQGLLIRARRLCEDPRTTAVHFRALVGELIVAFTPRQVISSRELRSLAKLGKHAPDLEVVLARAADTIAWLELIQ